MKIPISLRDNSRRPYTYRLLQLIRNARSVRSIDLVTTFTRGVKPCIFIAKGLTLLIAFAILSDKAGRVRTRTARLFKVEVNKMALGFH